jgi:sec-independent protein translocase protein TatB
MQLIGIGIPELLLILGLTVLVVGPERLPEVAAQLAKWIRQAQAYANYVRKDFNDFIGDIEKETGTSRKDLEDIGKVLRRDIDRVGDEVNKATREIQEATDLEKAAGGSTIAIGGAASGAANGAAANGVADTNGAIDSTAHKEAAMAAASEDAQASEPPTGEAVSEPKDVDWFVPAPSRRRRRADGDGA